MYHWNKSPFGTFALIKFSSFWNQTRIKSTLKAHSHYIKNSLKNGIRIFVQSLLCELFKQKNWIPLYLESSMMVSFIRQKYTSCVVFSFVRIHEFAVRDANRNGRCRHQQPRQYDGPVNNGKENYIYLNSLNKWNTNSNAFRSVRTEILEMGCTTAVGGNFAMIIQWNSMQIQWIWWKTRKIRWKSSWGDWKGAKIVNLVNGESI